jgi:signal transduction histidine kinase
MVGHGAVVPVEQHFILSTVSPSRLQKRLALAVVGGIIAVFLAITIGPFKGVRIPRFDSFVPIYAATIFVCDTITALLLYAQYAILRARATLVIASGYLFAALIVIPWILAFPGLFGSAGVMGGLQSTSWIYFFQHAGFSLFVIGYALNKDEEAGTRAFRGTLRTQLAVSAGLTLALVLAIAWVAFADEPLLPHVVLDSTHLGPLWPYAGAPVALTSVAAMVLLWQRRRTVVDLWLMVVMLLFSVEIPLSYYPTPERFSVGWYAVRVFGVLASSIVLIALLHEIATLYARLVGAVLGQRRERQARLVTGDAVAATIAHEVRQPLTAMITSADAGLRCSIGRRPMSKRPRRRSGSSRRMAIVPGQSSRASALPSRRTFTIARLSMSTRSSWKPSRSSAAICKGTRSWSRRSGRPIFRRFGETACRFSRSS